MKYFEKVPAKLLLQDGKQFEGWSAGKIGTTTGEICFNTGMTGYQEIFTDPSYYGQVAVMTNVHIGNYGTLAGDNESKQVQIRGLITRNYTNLFSRHMADADIQQFLLDNHIVAITGIDTRALVRHVRQCGAMNCVISSGNTDPAYMGQVLQAVPGMDGLELASVVSTPVAYDLGPEGADIKIAVLDLGVKKSILDNLVQRGARLRVFPAKSDSKDLEEWGPDGFFASNGPGDPAAMPYAVETVRAMLHTGKPFFGICLGHQIFARAMGIGTFKMHNGHRGINHPVLHLETGKCEITSQNHGFAVEREGIAAHHQLRITHVNLNDDTVEGLAHTKLPAFSVQYHPEASPGPHDARYLFDKFLHNLHA
ncbi:MAG: glutamine-hydrolyzing carbamoyl-phosphate synthase small subunit [Bacteroidetes bacterium]|jgi:carbamoyl-phosphate synthase small subunit|nr:glutamine-hydrolyzing carbamoyl-phosphate synthase small subunit [Bacteroidota bacterium]